MTSLCRLFSSVLFTILFCLFHRKKKVYDQCVFTHETTNEHTQAQSDIYLYFYVCLEGKRERVRDKTMRKYINKSELKDDKHSYYTTISYLGLITYLVNVFHSS